MSMRKIAATAKFQISRNNKKVFNAPANNSADKRKHGYTVNAHDMKLAHYRFIENNHDAILEAGLEQIAIKNRRIAEYKERGTCQTVLKKGMICGNWKGATYPMCRLCNWLSKHPETKDKRLEE